VRNRLALAKIKKSKLPTRTDAEVSFRKVKECSLKEQLVRNTGKKVEETFTRYFPGREIFGFILQAI
jgi:hypothetical protein